MCSFAVNVSLKQNAEDLVNEFSLETMAVYEALYVVHGLTRVDMVSEAITLQKKLQEILFAPAKFLLHNFPKFSVRFL